MTRPYQLDLPAAARLLAARSLSPVELVGDTLDRISAVEPRLRAFACLTVDAAHIAARRAEQEIVAGAYRGPLHGIPIALKDLIDTAGIPTTWGSAVHAGRVPDANATVWSTLSAAGAILVGKSVTHEMGCGTRCPPTSNPWDLERVPGGSSGGSAAALAAGMCAGALGTDTGGSIRIPAACCGVVGFKPTSGRVSRYGVMLASWTLDHIGPLARSVEGAAMLLGAIADPGSGAIPDYRLQLEDGVSGLRLGVPPASLLQNIQPDVGAAFNRAVSVLVELGAHMVSVPADPIGTSPELASLIALPELAHLHGGDLRQPELLDEQVRCNLELGVLESAATYMQAQRDRKSITRAFEAQFAELRLDGLLLPTLPVTAARKDQSAFTYPSGESEDVEAAYVRLCTSFNLAGLPALSVPAGFGSDGMPIGLQIAGRRFNEAMVLRIGRAYERATNWPTLATL